MLMNRIVVAAIELELWIRRQSLRNISTQWRRAGAALVEEEERGWLNDPRGLQLGLSGDGQWWEITFLYSDSQKDPIFLWEILALTQGSATLRKMLYSDLFCFSTRILTVQDGKLKV
jgi:hypothetical protein